MVGERSAGLGPSLGSAHQLTEKEITGAVHPRTTKTIYTDFFFLLPFLQKDKTYILNETV